MYKIYVTDYFKKKLKKLVKKDNKLKARLIVALSEFDKRISVDIGAGVFKLRLARENGGKSSGYRLYILIVEVHNLLTPISIYEKSSKDSLRYEELVADLLGVRKELELL